MSEKKGTSKAAKVKPKSPVDEVIALGSPTPKAYDFTQEEADE